MAFITSLRIKNFFSIKDEVTIVNLKSSKFIQVTKLIQKIMKQYNYV